MALAEEMAVELDAPSLKAMHYRASTYLAAREVSGTARRRPSL